MFRHVMGNDPRPHFIHQSNLADYNPALPETDPNQGGILYPVIDGLLARYDAAFDRASAPLVAAHEHARSPRRSPSRPRGRRTWPPARSSAWLQDGVLHVKNLDGAPMDVPLTGTTVGDLYGGQKSGLDDASRPAPSRRSRPTIRPTPRPRPCRARRRVGVHADRQQRRVDRHAADRLRLPVAALRRRASCANIPGATGATYRVTARRRRREAARGRLGRQLGLVGQPGGVGAADAATRAEGRAATAPGSNGVEQSGSRLSLTKVKMSPRRFAVSHKRKRRGTRLDGSRITWKLNQAGDGAPDRPAPRRQRQAPPLGARRHDHSARPRRAPASCASRGRFGRKLLSAARLPARGHGHRRDTQKSAAQARDLPGGEGMSGEERPRRRRRFRRVAGTLEDDGRPASRRPAGLARTPSSCCCARRTPG